jgi:hypothetical protein
MKRLLLTMILLGVSFNTFGQNSGSYATELNTSGENSVEFNSASLSHANLILIPASLAFIGDLANIEDSGVEKYTSKYNGMSAAKVQVSKELIKLIIYKQRKDCSTSALCGNATVPMNVNFRVTAAAVSQCHDWSSPKILDTFG